MLQEDLPVFSARATAILQSMTPDVGYTQGEMRALAPDLSPDALREVMHELWIGREVERYQDTGWRRVRTVRQIAPGDPETLRVGRVKPEDLFDHEAFSDWFA
jgi:hypothetical protein